MSALRLGIVTTHPIQYHSPWLRRLAARPELDLEVLYCHRPTGNEQAAAGFGIDFDWDTDLFTGYSHRFLPNAAPHPNLHRFNGISTPVIGDVLRAGYFDAVLVMGWHYRSSWQTIVACWRAGIPVMIRGDSHLRTPRSRMKVGIKRAIHGRFIPRFDACLAAGTWSREYFLHYGASPERVFIVPHAPDHDFLSDKTTQLLPRRSDLRSHWSLSRGSTVFLLAGKLLPRKRPLDLIRAASAARGLGANIELLVVGDGPLRAICQEEAQNLGVPVTWAGFLNQTAIPSAYVASDALVLPSDGSETWGLVVDEAMACGLPCIVSDQVGCGPDLVVAGQTGHVYRMGDITALAQLLVRHSGDRSRLAQMGDAARAHEYRYSYQPSVDAVVDALDAVTERKRRRGRAA